MPGRGIFCLTEILTLSVKPALRRVLKRHVGERGAVSHADLPEDVMQVDLGRAGRHLQPASDLLVGQSFGGERHDLPLPRRQQIFDRDMIGLVAGLFPRALQQLERQAFLASRNAIDAAQQLVRVGILQQEPVRSLCHRGDDVAGLDGARE